MSVYNELRLEKKLCDAVIRVENVEFYVHKIILCNCSPFFQVLFTRWSTPDCLVFDVPNVSADMMKLFIEFAYTECVPVTLENVQELFIAADRYNVTGIVQACSDLLEKQLTPQNCIGIMKFTDIYYTPELKNKAFLFALNHFEEVAATSEEFMQLSAQELSQIIGDDRLNVKQEKMVFRAILSWISYAAGERREYISLLLPKVRLALMNLENFIECVSNNPLVKESEDCKSILLRTLKAMLDLQTMSFFDSIYYHPLARPRMPSAIMLAFGGWRGRVPTDAIQAYDVRADRWVNVTSNMEGPRAYHCTVFLEGSVYCVGGFDRVERLSSVHRFDLVLRTWQKVAEMHVRRCFVTVTVMDGFIYAMGGYDGEDRHNTVERYQPRANQWTLIAPMHEQRSDASSTSLHGKVYICGGFNGNESLSTAECYDPESNQWTLIASMGSGRSGVGVVAYADHVFAVGGFDGTSRLSTAEAYNPETDTWHAVPSMLSSRSNFGIALIDDRLFVVGGFNDSSTFRAVECFDVEADEWSDARDLETSCSALSCCVVYGLPNLAEYASPHHSVQISEAEEREVE
ncbi:kelch-like protein 10 [Eleginops maclovinus]|uniref:kelch-like protein 10 n=1 Tax=Eleginops maclovinus TaxID=56733 RepID=UPI0030805B25